MRILLVTSHFYPENFKANDLAFDLANRGHEVTVLTPIPDYPEGKFYNGYGLFKRRKERINGVTVYRSLIIPRHNGTAVWLALNYLSYTFFSILWAFYLGIRRKYDSVIVHETSPIMVGIPAVIVKKMHKIPMHFWVLDLWPESLSAAGGIKSKWILGLFNKLTKWIYNNCDTILIGSKGYRTSIEQKGNFSKKIHYFPNWVEPSLRQNTPPLDLPKLPDGFNVVIAGNMGDAQDLPHILDAALRLKNTIINFIFIGDGRKKEYVTSFVAENDLFAQVHCLGRYPLESMPHFFAQADVLLFALKDKEIFSLTCPSRLQAYMSAGKPIVAMINGEGVDIINEAQCGWAVPSESSDQLAELLLRLSSHTSNDILQEKGLNGQRYSEQYFNFDRCMDNLSEVLNRSYLKNESTNTKI